MKIKWFLDNEKYEEYKKHQHEYMDDNCDGDYMGSVRTGELCYDIINWGNHLWFDLYVGGVDTGYGYSDKEDYKGYPYDYCDVASFKWDDNISQINLEDFEKELSEYIEEHINTMEGYVTDVGAIPVSLIDKANEELKLW